MALAPFRPAAPAGVAGLHALWASVADERTSGAGRYGSGAGSGGTDPIRPVDDPDLDRVQALVTLAQQGDAEAFGVLYERYVDVVYKYVYYRVGSHHTAQDLTSETFVRALRRLDGFTWTGRDIAAWFITIARNIVLDHVKSSRYKLEVSTAELLDGDERAPSPEQDVLQRLRDERLVEAMRELKPDQQECLALRFLQGLTLAETAQAMGRSPGAVKQLQLRAVRALHRQLGGERP
ncbi:RNA polymerase sigma factor [Angustibacter sp. McL0619]|uniref:RNA polymerase sigma factor n=1 Tax=Angustibacter sp. McL0619 TaxID=3415676 RepID=UPI003CF8D53A